MKKYILYMHTNKIDNKKYIGITSVPLNRRTGNTGYGYKKSPRFWHAIQKYGWGNFDHKILIANLTLEEANKSEQFYIKKYNTTDPQCGYNIESGGNCVICDPITTKWKDEKYDGIEKKYHGQTLYSLAQLLGINSSLIQRRIYSCQWTIDEAFGFVPHDPIIVKNDPRQKIYYFGTTHKEFYGQPIEEVCKILNLSIQKVLNKIYNGLSIDDALEFTKERLPWNRLMYDGSNPEYKGLTVYQVCQLKKNKLPICALENISTKYVN